MLKSLKLFVTKKILPRKFLLFSLVLIIDSLILFLRKPDFFYRPQFWAEDGAVFFIQAHNMGVYSLFQPYAGYFHLFPRLVAIIAQFFTVKYAPLIYNFSFIVSIAIVLGYLFSSRIKLDNTTKLLFGIGIAIVPLKGEMLMTLTNAQWVLALGILLLLIAEKPRNNNAKFLDIFLLIIFGLTGPFILIFLPLFLIKLFLHRSYYNLLSLFLVILLGFLQHINMLITNRADGKFFLLNFDFIKIIGIRCFQLTSGFLPQNIIDQSAIMQFIFCTFFVILYIFLLKNTLKNLPLNLIFIPIGGLLIFLSTLYSFKANPGILASLNDRYFFIPYVTIFWSLATLRFKNKVISIMLLALISLSFIPFLLSKRDAPLKNLERNKASKCIDRYNHCVVPINPDGWEVNMLSKEPLSPYGWSFKETAK
jgi:hypothetical protein